MSVDRDASGSSTVWVVDDDEDVAPHLRMVLRRADLEVDVRSFPDMASLRSGLTEPGPAPDLVLVDRMLPTGDGATLVPEIAAAFPETAIRLLTAAPDEASEEDTEIGVLAKPLSSHTIATLLTT